MIRGKYKGFLVAMLGSLTIDTIGIVIIKAFHFDGWGAMIAAVCTGALSLLWIMSYL